jgi:hypothetical protein
MGKTTLFYDVASGLKVAESIVMEQGGKIWLKLPRYGDYREVKGVKVPFIIQNVGFDIDIKMSDVKSELLDTDFQ